MVREVDLGYWGERRRQDDGIGCLDALRRRRAGRPLADTT
jgi:hypothetical protein